MHLKDYIVRAEKILYYTLEKVQFKFKLNIQTEFYFADSCDTILTSSLFKSQKKNDAHLLMTSGKSLLLVNTRTHFVRDVSSLSILNENHSQPVISSEYVKMILSYLRILFNISGSCKVYEEEDHGIEVDDECDEQVHSLNEEAMKQATQLRDVYALFRKG